MSRACQNPEEGKPSEHPLARVLDELRRIQPSWDVALGVPQESGWITGEELRLPDEGKLRELLAIIGARLATANRKAIAGAFALRFGWSSAVAIGPYLLGRCVPDLATDNIALRFTADAFFARFALRSLRACALGPASEAGLTVVSSEQDLREALRKSLLAQAGPVVEALASWSRWTPAALWGQVLSSWAGQFANILTELGRPLDALAETRAFFFAPYPAFKLSPAPYALEHAELTRVYHRRGSCCLYYKTPAGSLCVSCPLLKDDERLSRNRTWMESLRDAR